jgi:GTP-binding protein LepA
VDSTQGIQAQTLANYRMVKKANLDIVPVVTKLDLPHSNPEGIKEQMFYILDIDPDEVVESSAKTGVGIDEIFKKIIEKVKPPPTADKVKQRMRCHLLDSWFDVHRGVVCMVKVVDGKMSKGDRVKFMFSDKVYDVQDLGILTPERMSLKDLKAGQVGYLVCGIRSIQEILLGDTIYGGDGQLTADHALQKFERKHAMVFASIYPCDSETFIDLEMAMDKLLLNDASVQAQKDQSDALGMGYTCGFNGVLHMEVFCERLTSEFGVDVVITAPSVPYIVTYNKHAGSALKGKSITINSPRDLPDPFKIETIEEPMVLATIISPAQFNGEINEICREHRGIHKSIQFLGDEQILMEFNIPLSEVVTSFYNRIKSLTSGHATVDFEDAGFQPSDLVKLDILVNGSKVDALSLICDRKQSVDIGKKLTAKLRETIDRQLYEIIVQAAIGTKIVARERIAPYRKDVLTKGGKTVGGGDVTRKMKLLNRQKEGKKRMKQIGNVSLSQDAFLSVLKM